MADITQIGGGGPVEIDGTLTTRGTGTHSGAHTFGGTREHSGATTFSATTRQTGAHCSSHATVTAAGSGGANLGNGPYHSVTSGADAHIVKVPSAQAAGQVCWIFNVGTTHDCVVHNQGGANIEPGGLALGEGKVMLAISTGTGNNWKGIILN